MLSAPAPFSHFAKVRSLAEADVHPRVADQLVSGPAALRISWYGGTPGSLVSNVCDEAIA